jgi:hypothetical protein
MAELHVEPKKHSSSTWIWILVSLAIVAIVAYFLLRDNKATDNDQNRNTTSYIQQDFVNHLNNAQAA